MPEILPWDETEETQELFGSDDNWLEKTDSPPALLPRPIPGVRTLSNPESDPARNPIRWLGEFFRGLFGG